MSLSTQPRQRTRSAAHQQKRYGQHRKQTKPFLKTYWPYLPLFGIAAIIIVFAGARVLGPTGAVIGSVSVAIGLAAIAI